MTSLPKASQDAGILFLHALTPIHPGSGTAIGVVDLPVQRERHTDWPLIPGSALKGVLRDACRGNGQDEQDLFVVFGPDTVDAHAHAGALSLTDARPLAFPVRSLSGVFAWVTCPAVLDRLNRDLAISGRTTLGDIPEIAPGQAALDVQSPLLVEGNKVVLEEFDFTRVGEAQEVLEWFGANISDDQATGSRMRKNTVVLSDDDFTHFVRHATEVMARIGLDYQTKTVKGGALFYEEFLPAETVFYSLALATKSRRADRDMRPDQVFDYLEKTVPLPHIIQIGADETIGKGLCAARLVKGGEV